MNTASVTTGLLAAAAVAVMPSASGAWAQDALSIANNDSVNIDATTFKVAPGNAKGDLSAQINKLVARELGAGAIVFRASDRLYIIEADANLKMVLAYDPARPYAYDPGDARRFMYDQHSDPRRFAVDPARPYAYDPGDARRFAVDPNDRRCTAAYQNDPRCPPINDSNGAIYVNDPDYAQYRLKKAFDENWAATSTNK